MNKQHAHGHHQQPPKKSLHKDWRLWIVVAMMLAAMLVYVVSFDEQITPAGNVPVDKMPAAAP